MKQQQTFKPVTTMPVKVAPSILAADFTRLGEEVRAMTQAGADAIHIDVMDGHFVPNLSIGPGVVRALRPCSPLPFDVHLMIAPVEPYLDAFLEAGADSISVHPESGPHLHRSLTTIQDAGRRAGVVLNPATSLACIDPVLSLVEAVMVMTVNPGFGGQSFLFSQLEKISACRRKIDDSGQEIDLQVDGGITAETAHLALKAGANFLIAGTAAFSGGAENYAANIAALRTGIPST